MCFYYSTGQSPRKMNPMLGLGLLFAGLLTVEGLLNSKSPVKYRGPKSQIQSWKGMKAAEGLIKRNTDFGCKLYRKLVSNSPRKNIFFSPLSISAAFSMLSLGAQDSTLDEIKQGFNFRNMPERDIHEGFHYLIYRMNQGSQDLELHLRNTLFIDQKLQPEKKFLTNVKNLYSADTVPTNFQNLGDTRKRINDYVSQKTQGKINNLIKNIDPGTVMLLTNCIFFRARWQHEFDPKITKEEDFFLDGNQRVKVPMMFRGGMYETGYDEQLSCTILEMPYQGTISATFILPDEGKMKTVEEALKADTFDRWKKLITRRVVDVSLPRFSITGNYDLKRTLSYLGITKIFEEHGDLTRISPHRSLKVGEAVHEAVLKMDEKGTEGAAGSGAQTLPMQTPLPIKLNKPFLVFIKDDVVSTIIFLGKIVNPTGK
ncbi:serpin A12 isoform X1 [Canis lupus familiaris]|uniref:serpin A12 isoform X1 n=2 Tax=Canis lupus familiaris TaxID=9615 RepID=UPI0018F73EB2|nr:serpin A12 isoform X1 [Canis lupus familiaris]